ncbi:MAG TPA: peptidoglycan-binding protein [Thermodesulfobacteriota bacterium]|nr:peptidoglycan-binding protein [Thermodesulfobacteriota bacterium]
MPEYTVKQGDTLPKIAAKHGFQDYQTICNHPQNSTLKKKRQNPNILYPGDKVFIPEKDGKEVSGGTDQKHTFKRKGKPLILRIKLVDMRNKPLAGADCELHIEGNVYCLTSDSQGRIEHEIPPSAEDGRLVVKNPAAPPEGIPIRIGHLDPIEEVSGWKARLNNLGYNAGPIDDKETEPLRSAVEEFQIDHFKDPAQVDGKCGPKTQAKLKEVHGC